MHDWQTTLLALCFLASTAAFFVMWSKYEEQKQKTTEEHNAYRNALEYGNAIAEALKEERNRRWDEISRAVGLENEILFWKEANEDKAKDILYYHEHCKKQADALKIEMERTSRLERDNAQLEQNLRSALRCPNNDHVWKDGRCVKCGRMKDALS